MNESPLDHPVVVGVRDQQPGLLNFACGLADVLGCPLQVMHCYSVPFPYSYTSLYTGQDLSDVVTSGARQVIADARSHLGTTSRCSDIEYKVVHGHPPAVLGAESHVAKALVIGTDDLSWIDRISGAAVTNFLCLHAASPVVVVPPAIDTFDIDDVVVTIDGETSAQGPLQFAFELADRAGVDLQVLHAAQRLASFSDFESEGLLVAEVLAGWSQTYPDVTITSELTTGNPADQALRAAGDASLIVAGRPHPDRRGGWRFPVARILADAGVRPIAVIPADYSI